MAAKEFNHFSPFHGKVAVVIENGKFNDEATINADSLFNSEMENTLALEEELNWISYLHTIRSQDLF